MRRADPVRVIEAAYTLEHDDTRWLSGIVDSAQTFNTGSGIYAFIYHLDDGTGVPIKAVTGTGATTDLMKGRQSLEALGPDLFRALFGPAPTVVLASRGLRFANPIVRQIITGMWNAEGVEDHLGVKAVDPSGESILLGFALPFHARTPPRRVDTLARISAHLVSALRLRRALAGIAPHPDDVRTEAVLEPGGKLVHARTPAKASDCRNLLSRAVRAVDRARGPLRRSEPEKAVGIWRGLVEGRWTLIDHHDSDGRRFVLARRNDPAARDPRSLMLRERQVLGFAALGHSNKMIAYELGLTPSTVAGHLQSLLAKLKLTSRREMIEMFGWRNPAK